MKFHGDAVDLLLVYLHNYFISLRPMYCTAARFYFSLWKFTAEVDINFHVRSRWQGSQGRFIVAGNPCTFSELK